jgi:hypothetical protein
MMWLHCRLHFYNPCCGISHHFPLWLDLDLKCYRQYVNGPISLLLYAAQMSEPRCCAGFAQEGFRHLLTLQGIDKVIRLYASRPEQW